MGRTKRGGYGPQWLGAAPAYMRVTFCMQLAILSGGCPSHLSLSHAPCPCIRPGVERKPASVACSQVCPKLGMRVNCSHLVFQGQPGLSPAVNCRPKSAPGCGHCPQYSVAGGGQQMAKVSDSSLLVRCSDEARA